MRTKHLCPLQEIRRRGARGIMLVTVNVRGARERFRSRYRTGEGASRGETIFQDHGKRRVDGSNRWEPGTKCERRGGSVFTVKVIHPGEYRPQPSGALLGRAVVPLPWPQQFQGRAVWQTGRKFPRDSRTSGVEIGRNRWNRRLRGLRIGVSRRPSEWPSKKEDKSTRSYRDKREAEEKREKRRRR